MYFSNSTEKFNVVILYDHVTSVGRAMAAYARLARELENDFIPELRIWRIDVAISQECAIQAGDDIEASELVIMAVRGSQLCPPSFLRWVENSGRGSGLLKRVLIAIIDAADEPAPSAGNWSSILCGAVAQIHPDAFIWAPPSSFTRLRLGRARKRQSPPWSLP